MTAATGIVYKYFDLIDGFIRVRVLPPDEPLPAMQEAGEEPPTRREYRRLVVHSCVLGVEDEVLPKVHTVYPEDAIAAEDLLYQICVDVNPSLDIHAVALPAGGEDAGAGDEHRRQMRERAEALEENVLREVVGQDESVGRICRAVRKAACGIHDPLRPIGSFLLVGRTGTGKTELAKSVARHLYPHNELVRVDCSEYALPHETAKLIGAPPGYVGHSDGGHLTEALKRDERCVVLFDEIEKGHEKLHNMLLQILDEGRLTDNKGETVSFREAVVLMTSNVGTADYSRARQRVGFERGGPLSAGDFESITREALARDFRPELLNRLDGVLTFRALAPGHCTRIADMQLEQLRARMSAAGIEFRWTRQLAAGVARAGFCEEFGAREVRRKVAALVEEPLSNLILDRGLEPGVQVTAHWLRGAVDLRLRAGDGGREAAA